MNNLEYSSIHYSNTFSKAVTYAQQANLAQSLNLFEKMLMDYPYRYSLHINIGTINMQTQNFGKALEHFQKAIELDPFHHAAYYNCFLCYNNMINYTKATQSIMKALSCLYAYHAKQTKDKLFINKSINYCQNNIRAYLTAVTVCTDLHQYTKAQNYFAQVFKNLNCHNIEILREIYSRQSQFYLKIGRNTDSQKCLIKLLAQESKRNASEAFKLKCKNFETATIEQYELIIRESVGQFKKLLQNVQKEDEKLASEIKIDHFSTLTETQKDKLQSSQGGSKVNISYLQSTLRDGQQNQLNQQIKRVQNEIKEQGGKLELSNKSVEQSFNFPSTAKAIHNTINYSQDDILDLQIQKAMKQLKIDSQEKYISTKNMQSMELSKKSSNTNPKNIEIQIKNAKFSHQSETKGFKNFYVQLRFGNKTVVTQSYPLQWNEIYEFRVPYTIENKFISVKLFGKGGLIWSDACLGQGHINISDVNCQICRIRSEQRQIAIIRYHLKCKPKSDLTSSMNP